MAENTASTDFTTALTQIEKTCDAAGLEVMWQVLSIVVNREEVPVETLTALTPEEVYDLYESFVGPAVDRLEQFLLTEGD